MAASTIGRTVLTDGVGGTVLNNALWQASIYDKIDAVIAAAITFGSTVSAEGFGTHTFSAGGSGGNKLALRNTSSGTVNFAQLRMGNNSVDNIGEISVLSSAWTTSNELIASALAIRSNGAGGISLGCSDASGTIRFFPNNNLSSEAMRLSVQSNLLSITVPGNSFGARVLLSDNASADAAAVLQCGEPGISAATVIVGNNWYATSTAASARRNTSVGGSFQRFGYSIWELVSVSSGGVASTRMSMDSSGNFTVPGTIATGDLAFWNKFAWTEHYKVGIETPGLALVNADGDVVIFCDERGGLHAAAITPDLHTLGWQRTTADQRAAVGHPGMAA